MEIKRRDFLKGSIILAASAYFGIPPLFASEKEFRKVREFHFSLSGGPADVDPELLEIIRSAGVTKAWLPGYASGGWWISPAGIDSLRRTIEAAGMDVHVINIPLGHPGPTVENPPFGRLAIRADGTAFTGTSMHKEILEDNIRAVEKLKAIDPKFIFLDDDFRLASTPGMIGGCFCDEHKSEFLRIHGLGESQWNELLENIKSRDLTPVLRDWVNFTCDELTSAFGRLREAAMPEIELGIMVMYLGSEKAGIRPADYRNIPFRVGELMFDDDSFKPAKGKTNELFSVLFHRRFIKPDLAYSESTAAPADKLSGENMAAKLCISTISDVRNTMFMFSLKTFPREYWEVIAPAMRKNAKIHEYTANHRLKGPFKHYYGQQSRFVGDDNPYSLFLAAGVPFEVTSRPASDGWTFLSNFDAKDVKSGDLKSSGTTFVCRPSANVNSGNTISIPESMEEIFDLKKRILPSLKDVPYIIEDVPVVCAWYPTAKAVLLWNLTEEKQKLTLSFGRARRPVSVGPLDIELVKEVTSA